MNKFIKPGTFLYFAYGSNLLKKRLQLQNPTAEFLTIGKLDGYQLGFDFYGDRWMGAAATINQTTPGDCVWGAVWRVNDSDSDHLDEQEGVSFKVYERLEGLNVKTSDGVALSCRSYKLLRVGSTDRRPSPHYLDVIVRGAEEIALPQDYIQRLKSIEHNGFSGRVPVYDSLALDSADNRGLEFMKGIDKSPHNNKL